jgi:hypothetical protein
MSRVFLGRYNSVKYFFLEKTPFQFHFGKSYPPVYFAHYRLKCCVVSQKERMAITGRDRHHTWQCLYSEILTFAMGKKPLLDLTLSARSSLDFHRMIEALSFEQRSLHSALCAMLHACHAVGMALCVH